MNSICTVTCTILYILKLFDANIFWKYNSKNNPVAIMKITNE